MGSRDLRVAQIGKQSVFGTPVAATAKLMGLTDLSGKPEITIKQSTYLQGDLAPSHAARATDKRGSAKLAGDLTFEDAPIYLTAALKGGVLGTGATADKTWDFPAPLATTPNVDLRTVEIHDGSQEYELTDAFINQLTIAGAAANDGLVTFSADWLGRELVKSTLTPALANRAIDTIPVGGMSLYVDAIGATIGTTIKAATLIDFSFQYNPNTHFKKFADGDIRPSAIGYARPTAQLMFTAEFNASAIAELDQYIAGTPGRLVRLVATGPTLGSSAKKFQLDFAGDIMNVSDLWGDRDGNTTLQFTLSARYDSATFANYVKMQIVNGNATNPG